MGKCDIMLFIQNHKTTQDICKTTHIELDHQEKYSILDKGWKETIQVLTRVVSTW